MKPIMFKFSQRNTQYLLIKNRKKAHGAGVNVCDMDLAISFGSPSIFGDIESNDTAMLVRRIQRYICKKSVDLLWLILEMANSIWQRTHYYLQCQILRKSSCPTSVYSVKYTVRAKRFIEKVCFRCAVLILQLLLSFLWNGASAPICLQRKYIFLWYVVMPNNMYGYVYVYPWNVHSMLVCIFMLIFTFCLLEAHHWADKKTTHRNIPRRKTGKNGQTTCLNCVPQMAVRPKRETQTINRKKWPNYPLFSSFQLIK